LLPGVLAAIDMLQYIVSMSDAARHSRPSQPLRSLYGAAVSVRLALAAGLSGLIWLAICAVIG